MARLEARDEDARGSGGERPPWLDLLVRTSLIGVGLGDLEGRALDANEVLLGMLGYSRAEVTSGRVDWRQITPREHADADDRAIREVRERGTCAPYEKEMLAKDGSRVPVLVRFAAVPGTAETIVAYVVDLRPLRETQSALHESENRFRMLVEGAREYAILLLDAEGRFETWNSGAVKIVGHAPADMIGQPSARLYLPEEVAEGRPERELADAAAQGKVEGEGWRLRSDGRPFWASYVITAYRAPDGSLSGYSQILRDMTERRHAEVLLRSVVDNTLDGIISIDHRGAIQSFNASARRIFGYEEAEVVGRNVSMLMPEPYRSSHDGYLRHYLTTGDARIIGIGREVRGRRKNGTEFPMDLAVGEFSMAGRRYFTGIVRDISERKKLEEQLRLAQRMESIGQLAGGVAHDFNNLLTIITGYSQLLLSELGEDDPRREPVAEIRYASERAGGLTRQLLAFGRRQVLKPQVLGLNEVVTRVEAMLQRLIGEDIRLTTRPDPYDSRVRVDPGQIEQVILNLAANARDAMPQGGRLTIEVRQTELDEQYCRGVPGLEPGPFVLLTVTDNGCGIPPEVREHVFEPFFTTKPAGKGTGLGLATVYGIVKQSGGHISLYSEVGVGTTMKVYLPRVVSGEPVLAPPEAAPRPGSERILLVEDEAAVRLFIRRALESQGYAVLEARSGEEAIGLARGAAGRLDLLLTDVVMPEISGRRLAEMLRVENPRLRVLYMSGYTDDAVVRHGILHAEVDFLEKPFGPPVLFRKVREVLDRPGS